MDKVSVICGRFVFILCLVVLAGWQFDIPIFRSLIPGVPETTPLTMSILMTLSLALLVSYIIINQPQRAQLIWLCWALAGVGILIAVWTGIQYIFGLDPSIELIFYPQQVVQRGGDFPGRPSPHTAISATLVGLSIALSPLPGKRYKRLTLILALAALSIAWLALFGYASVTNPFYAVPSNPETGISPLTAFGVVALAFGVIGLRYNEGFLSLLTASTSGGQVVRMFLPIAIIAPLLLGWVTSYSGVTDNLSQLVLFAVSWGGTSLIFMSLIIWQGFSLHHRALEKEKAAAEKSLLFEQLQQAEEKFRTIIESAPDGMVIVNEHGRIVLVNAQTEALFGYERKALIDQPIEILIPHAFRDRHIQYRRLFSTAPRVRPMGANLVLFALRSDDTEFPVEVSLSPLETTEGRLITATVRNITEKKQVADQLQQNNIQLTEQAEALERNNMELQQFAYVASHDLQAPLRNITGFMQLLQRNYRDKLDNQADEWINRASGSTQQLEKVVQDILAYSRVDARPRPFEPILLAEIFDELVTMLSPTIQDSRARVTRGTLPTVMGDRAQITQVLQNLIGNGLKYQRDISPKIHISAREEHDRWVIAVQDNGIGIESKDYLRIFEIFERLHGPQEYPGSGIGLAICRRIIQRHRGKIWVESEPGRGSTFYFTLPQISQTNGKNM
ncbi:MAG: PAS domain S-box protein [Anaerolineae bacterium]|nr:PAS domain S-box protein [Anaerolineae bacterium]